MFGLFKKKQPGKQIRPMLLDDFTGQDSVKKILSVAINGAKARRDTLEHVVMYGPPGLGKTTLAGIIKNEMKTRLVTALGTSLQKQSDIIDLFDNVLNGDILFIDEIHRLPIKLEEMLYTAMEDRYIDYGNTRISLPKFTLIGATTRVGDLSEPMRDRFGICIRLDYYTRQELFEIAMRTSEVYQIALTSDAAYMLAYRSRGTPRVLNNFIKRARDISPGINSEVVTNIFELMGIDYLGLDAMDRKILSVMVNDYKCKPVGLNMLATCVGEEPKTISEVYEPYLITSGLILPTSRGRIPTAKAIAHILSS